MSRTLLFATLMSAAGLVFADQAPESEPEPKAPAAAEPAPQQEGPKVISGMSILGNQEAPKSLVIVPWKSSRIGQSAAVSTMLDDSRQPVDREVFMRELSYYEIRSEDTREGS